MRLTRPTRLTTRASLIGRALQSESRVYAWDDGNEVWVAGDTLDDLIAVTGHSLAVNPRTGLVESLNRALVGPGHVCARTRRDSLLAALTAWVA